MPIPFMDDLALATRSVFFDRAKWDIKFSLWPRKCFISGRSIWLKYAYRGTAIWTGPGDPIVEVHWVNPQEYMFMVIRGR